MKSAILLRYSRGISIDCEGQICHGPMERSSCMLPVAVGCFYNRCKFCTLFRHLKYRELLTEQIEAELERVRNPGENPRHVFLGGGNTFGLDTDCPLRITDLIHRYFPDCCVTNIDATVTDIRTESQEGLQALRAADIRHLYSSTENDPDDVLVHAEEDHNLDQVCRQTDRIQNAGFIYGAHIMTRIAGHGRGRENVYATAKFFNCTRPRRVINFSSFLSHSVPLYRKAQAKTFVPATELKSLQEGRLLLELLTTPGPLVYDGFHDHTEFQARGALSGEGEKMLGKLDRAIERYKDQESAITY